MTQATESLETRGCPRWGNENAPKKGLRVACPLSILTHPLSPVLPETQPRLATPKIVEVGTQWTVNCSLDGLFPAVEAEVHLTLAEQELHCTPLYGKDSVLAMASVKANAEEEGTQQLACVVTLGGQDRKWKENVILYRKSRWGGASKGWSQYWGRCSLCAHSSQASPHPT